MIKKTVAHSGCFAIWRYLNLKLTSLKFLQQKTPRRALSEASKKDQANLLAV